MSNLQASPHSPTLTSVSWRTRPAGPGSDRRADRGILIVDDDEMVRTFLGMYLREQGVAVWVASDGDEAAEVFRQHSQDVAIVVLDLDMAGRGCLATLSRLRAMDDRVSCSVLVEDGTAIPHEAFAGQGEVDFLAKPFLFNVLRRQVQKSLDRGERMLDLNAIGRFAQPYLRQAFGELVRRAQALAVVR